MAAPLRRHVLSNVKWKQRFSGVQCVRWTCYRMIYIRKHIADALNHKDLIGKHVEIKGWVNAIRNHKDVTFLNITDGTSLRPLQVLSPTNLTESITFGSSVSVEGRLVANPAKGQSVEMTADTVQLIGPCDDKEYPFKVKERHSADYLRGFPHLRHRTNVFSALLRIRNTATMALHQYFQNEGYCLIHMPIITSSDPEGAGEVFTLKPLREQLTESDIAAGTQTVTDTYKPSAGNTSDFFGHPTYLSVSGQLHLEAATGGFSKVYSFGPTFRAEDSRGLHHLCEFYMLEAMLAFTKSLEDILTVMESLVKTSIQQILEQASEDVELFHCHVAPGHRTVVGKILSSEFQRLKYDEAVKILETQNNKFQFKVSWGSDLQKEHEQYLVSYFNDCPVFVTDFPVQLKPFYARINEDGKTVSAVDLLFPGVGELFGGSLCEERYDVLKEKLDRAKLAQAFPWYLDIRKFGSAPHGGFGMGFERYLQSILGIANIKDTIPYPRWLRNCQM